MTQSWEQRDAQFMLRVRDEVVLAVGALAILVAVAAGYRYAVIPAWAVGLDVLVTVGALTYLVSRTIRAGQALDASPDRPTRWSDDHG